MMMMGSSKAESSRSGGGRAGSIGSRTSHKQAEMRARWEMAQAIQKPWPLHLLENGTKPAPQHHHHRTPSQSTPRQSQESKKSSSYPPSITSNASTTLTSWIRKSKPKSSHRDERPSSPDSASSSSPQTSPKPI